MAVRKYWTLAQIISKIEKDLAIEGEVFVEDEELLGYINEGIDVAEAEIHNLAEDYFMTKATLTLVDGTDEYDLPANIYGHKIRRITYRNGTKRYTLGRLHNFKKFEEYEDQRVHQSAEEYVYFIMNSTAGSPKIVLTPPAKEDGAYVTVWYWRQANRLEEDSDICDIPEFVNFVIQFAKTRIYEKEGHPAVAKAMDDLEKYRAQMQSTLETMVPDDDNEIPADLSFYKDMV
jgi:hypothetical protein